MADRAEYLQLDTSDDVASVRDRLSFLRGKRVLLIWPEEGTALTRKLDLVLIQREAMRRSIRLAVVSHDEGVIRHAQELNISAFETIGASERGKWKRGRSKVFTSRWQRPKDEPIPDDLKDIVSRIYAEESELERRWRWVRRAVLLVVLLAFAAAVVVVFVPSAVITLTPAQARVQGAAQIWANEQVTSIDIENRTMPITRITVPLEDSGTIETTGAQALGTAPASGSVVFVNLTDLPVEIPADTLVVTSAGLPIQFRTTQATTLDAGVGLQVEVPIEAVSDSAGEAGNVPEGVINTVLGDLASLISVRNLVPTVGGATRTQQVVTVDDQARLITTLRQQIQAQAYLEMQSKLADSQCLVLESIHIAEERSDWMTFSAEVGTVADTLTLSMKAIVEARAIDLSIAQQIVYAQMSSQVQDGQSIKPESLAYDDCGLLIINALDPATWAVQFSLTGSGIIAYRVDSDKIPAQVVGLTPADALNFLVTEYRLQPGIAPQLVITPDWFGRLPILPFRVRVELQDAPV